MVAAEEAGAEHRVGLPSRDRRQQAHELARVVLEVGVLHHDHVARRRRAMPVRSAAPLPRFVG